MDWLFGSNPDEERLHHLDDEKNKHLAECVENDQCKMRLSNYLEGLKTQHGVGANNNIKEESKGEANIKQKEGAVEDPASKVGEAPSAVSAPPVAQVPVITDIEAAIQAIDQKVAEPAGAPLTQPVAL